MIFAVELSTRRGGVALLKDGALVAKRAWDDPSARHTALWPAMESLVAETQLDWSAVELFAVGRGPGSYSGLRAALTAARMLAAPGGQPVMTVSSGAALAASWYEAHPNQTGDLVVAGDARRGSVWRGIFSKEESRVVQRREWALEPAPDFRARYERARVVSSDPARLRAAIGLPADAALAEEAFPSAESVARLAWSRARANLPGEALEPLYLHPPV